MFVECLLGAHNIKVIQTSLCLIRVPTQRRGEVHEWVREEVGDQWWIQRVQVRFKEEMTVSHKAFNWAFNWAD